MEVRPGSLIESLVRSVEEDLTKRAVQERLAKFPVSFEDYMALPESDRVNVSAQMVAAYFPRLPLEARLNSQPRDLYPAPYATPEDPVTLRTDHPGIFINGVVNYFDVEALPIHDDAPQTVLPELLIIWAQAEVASTQEKSHWHQLGRIELGDELFFVKDSEITVFDPSDDRIKEILEIIDATAAKLIEGPLAAERETIKAETGKTAPEDITSDPTPQED